MSRKPARTSSSASAAERRRVLYSGQVQGVGFRYSTLQIARRHVVTGYVRNLADGRVELVVEGERSILDAFLADVGGRLGHYIARSQVETQPVQNEFSGFDIAF